MEKLGFIASELLDKPMNNLPALFEGAFLANHRNVRRDKIDEIFDNMTEKDKLLAVLLEMYNEPIENLLAEPKKSAKNIKWTATV